MNNPIQRPSSVRLFILIGLFSSLLMTTFQANAQEKPPVPIEVTVSLVQNLDFGTFCLGDGSGTTVIIDGMGMRSATGNILLLSSSFSAALYDVAAIPGTLITILNGPVAILSGSNGGTIELQIGNSYPPSPFITTAEHTWITIGGTLVVGDAASNPPGAYSGTFAVTFIQE